MCTGACWGGWRRVVGLACLCVGGGFGSGARCDAVHCRSVRDRSSTPRDSAMFSEDLADHAEIGAAAVKPGEVPRVRWTPTHVGEFGGNRSARSLAIPAEYEPNVIQP